MANTENERPDVTSAETMARPPAGLKTYLLRTPPAVRRILGWCAIMALVVLIFSLSSLAAWWPR
jgi:hypothetical protein